MTDTTLDDAFADFDLACEFPWTEGSFTDLNRYIQAIHEFLPHSSAQHAVRLRSRIAGAADSIEVGEFESELEQVERDAATVLPRLVWGGALVAVYGTLESGITRTLEHWRHTVQFQRAFKRLPRKSFLDSAETYAKLHLDLDLFTNETQRAQLLNLGQLRNSFAHEGGLLAGLPRDLAQGIRTQAHPGLALEVSDGQWIPNERAALHYLSLAKRTMGQFGNAVLESCSAHNQAHPGEV